MEERETPPPGCASAGQDHALVRSMGLAALTIYGVGDMLGSGIYALVGRAAGMMGSAVWLAFCASMVPALLTGLAYASIGSRYPRAAGAAYVVNRAFRRPFISYVVGLAVMASGLTSMATASRAFAGYFLEIAGGIPFSGLVIAFILALTVVNFLGMRESTWLNALCTAVELGGLLFIIGIGVRYWGSVNYLEPPPDVTHGIGVSLVLQGAVLTFFSFVGFEDLLNVAEEVHDVDRTLPKALVLSLVIVTIVYIAVAVTAISVVPHAHLAAAKGPLVEVVRHGAPWFPPVIFTGVSMFAITNSALLNYIMGSRLVYGMARQGLLPRALGRVHPKRRTPHIAILCLMLVVLALALGGDISGLAKATSVLLLGVFVVVNLAFVVLKLRPGEPRGRFEVPLAVPIASIAACLLLIGHAQRQELRIAGALIAGISLLYLTRRPVTPVEPD